MIQESAEKGRDHSAASIALGHVPPRLARNAFMLEAGEQLDETATETDRLSTAAYPNVQNV